MIVQSATYGEFVVRDEEVVTLTQGMPGFESYTRYAIIRMDDESPFRIFQSLDDYAISFVLVYPYVFFTDYDIRLPEAALEELAIREPEEVDVWAIVTIQGQIRDATVNLMAPLIVNRTKRIGKQVILHESGYHVRHRLLPESSATSATEG